MDSRLIFRPRPTPASSNGGTPEDKPGAALERPRPSCDDTRREPRRLVERRREVERFGNPAAFSGQEKPRCEGAGRPYRKPTQVGEDECPQVIGRTLAKELGKLSP